MLALLLLLQAANSLHQATTSAARPDKAGGHQPPRGPPPSMGEPWTCSKTVLLWEAGTRGQRAIPEIVSLVDHFNIYWYDVVKVIYCWNFNDTRLLLHPINIHYICWHLNFRQPRPFITILAPLLFLKMASPCFKCILPIYENVGIIWSAIDSVARLGDFLKFLMTNFTSKEAQTFGNFLGYFESITL